VQSRPETPSGLTPESVIADLWLWDISIAATESAKAVDAMFSHTVHLPGVIVVEGAVVAGVISRREFYSVLSRSFARELFLNRPITLMLESVESRNPLVLAGDTSIMNAVERALDRPAHAIYDPVVVDVGAGLRLLESEVLLRAQSNVLATSVDELRLTLEALNHAQARLVQSEKMAALGNLVAGVAHEINTPIGIALTSASFLSDRTRDFVQLSTDGAMKRSDLTKYTGIAAESTSLLVFNIQRAAELIQSFKQIAVDQASEQRRQFSLSEYLGQLTASLTAEVRASGNSLVVSCPDGITMDGFPGALAQIFSNLVGNALFHAYEEEESGEIDLQVEEAGDEVVLTVADKGKGISAEDRARIFEPFFTTKRGLGGSGLGLHIVYNLVTERLQGSIDCESRVGGGTRFVVRIPRVAPA
jgi:signal transduction histidine kinase